jgi:prepilin-type N-terminal cleavage/methylation domain-containing protein
LCMQITRRLKAFSLVELLVVMVLSSIVVGIIYYSYLVAWKYHQKLTEKLTTLNQQNGFIAILRKDVQESNSVQWVHERQIVCHRELWDVVYTLADTVAFRTQAQQNEEYAIGTDALEASFRGIKAERRGTPLDYIQIVFSSKSSLPVLSIYKHYDVASALQLTPADTLR